MTHIDVNVLKANTAAYRQAQTNLSLTRRAVAVAAAEAVAGGMSQSEVARIVGTDRNTIRKWIDQPRGMKP